MRIFFDWGAAPFAVRVRYLMAETERKRKKLRGTIVLS